MSNDGVERRLYNFHLKLKGIEFAEGIILFLTASLFFIIAIAPLANYFQHNYSFFSIMRYGSFLFLGLIFVFLQIPVLKRYNAERTALLIENRIPQLKDTIINYIQLKKYFNKNTYCYSLNLISAYLENAEKIISGYNFKDAISIKSLKNNLRIFAAVSALGLLLVAISPDMFTGTSSYSKSPEPATQIVEKPEILNMQVELVFPRYTNLPPKIIKDNRIRAIAGTKAKITITCNKELKSANIKKNIPMNVKKNNASGEIIIKKDDDYYIELRDKDGYSNESPHYEIDAIPDNPPEVQIIEPGKNITIDERMVVPLKISIYDDYGIDAVELKAEITGRNETTFIILKQKSENSVFNYNWNLSTLGFLPEDTISYHVEAKDNDNINGPNIGKSDTYQIRFPSLFEIYKDTEEAQSSENIKLQNVLQEQKDLKERIEKFIKSMSYGEEFDWTKEKELESIHKGEEKVKENLENILKNMQTTTDRLSKSLFVNESTLEKIAEIHELLGQVLTTEMKELLDKINKALRQIEPSEKQKSLMETQFSQKEFEEKIDRTLNLLKRIQAEQKLDALINEVNQLADRQQKNIFPNKNAIREEKSIKKETGDVRNNLEKLSQDLKETDKRASEKLKETSSEIDEKELEKKMDDLIKKLESALEKGGEKIDENVSPELKGLAKKLSEIKNDFKEKSMQEILSAIEKTIDYGLIISSSGNEINEVSPCISEEKRQELAGKENNLKQGIVIFEKEYMELTKKFVFINPHLINDIQKAQENLSQSVEALTNGQTQQALYCSREGIGKVNSITFYLIKLHEELSNAPPGGGSGSFMDSLKNLSKRQENLNELTKNIDKLIKKNGGLTPQQEGILQQMAFEQSLIKQALEELEKHSQSLSEKIGNFGGTLNDMEDVEKGLKNKETDEKVQQRQRRILTRLLDAQKSIRQREAGKQWKSTSGQGFEIKEQPADLPESVKDIKKKILSEIENIPDEKIPFEYRELVEDYYKRLSEGR